MSRKRRVLIVIGHARTTSLCHHLTGIVRETLGGHGAEVRIHDLLADGFSRLLFRMSSTFPEPMVRRAQQAGFTVEPGARGFMFNATAVDLIKFLDIGTRPLLDR